MKIIEIIEVIFIIIIVVSIPFTLGLVVREILVINYLKDYCEDSTIKNCYKECINTHFSKNDCLKKIKKLKLEREILGSGV